MFKMKRGLDSAVSGSSFQQMQQGLSTLHSASVEILENYFFWVSAEPMLYLANLPDKCNRACLPRGWDSRLAWQAPLSLAVSLQFGSPHYQPEPRLRLPAASLCLSLKCLNSSIRARKTWREMRLNKVCQHNNTPGHLFQYVWNSV